MKKTKFNLIIVLLMLVIMMFSTISFADNETPVTTSENVSNNTTSESDNDDNESAENTATSTDKKTLEKFTGNYFASSGNVVVDKSIDGNAFVTGGDVKVTGEINGDLYVIANKLTIDGGSIYGNVFVLAPEVVLNGLLYNIYAICDTFTCEYDGLVALDLKVFANNIKCSGWIERNVYFVANESLELTDDAYILGNLYYNANGNVQISENSTVYGDVNSSSVKAVDKTVSKFEVAKNYVYSLVVTLTFTFIIWLVILLLTPKFSERTYAFATKKPWTSLGIGLLTLIIVPIVAILLMFISPLVSISLILMVLYVLLISICFTIVTLIIANYLNNKFANHKTDNSMAWYVLLVATVLWTLKQIPYVGFVITLLIIILGIGTFLLSIISRKSIDEISKKSKNVETSEKEAIEEKTDKVETKKEEKTKSEKPKKEPKQDNDKKDKE